MKKIIFLDVDGVLSCFGVRGLCGTRLDIFASIVKHTGAEVVLSSSWRRYKDQCRRLAVELMQRGVLIEDHTPVLHARTGTGELVLAATRAQEIKKWLLTNADGHPRTFVILDDDPNDEMGELKTHLVKTDGYQGLTHEIAERIIRILNA